MTDQRIAARPIQLEDANLFDITGPIVINYTRNSIAGVPLLSYVDAELSVRFAGREITQVDTTIGELVTVTLQDVVDAFVRTFTLVIPKIRLNLGEEVEFDAIGIETVDRSLAFVPAPGPSGVCRPTAYTICTVWPSGLRSRTAVAGGESGPGRTRRPAVGGPDLRSSGRD